MSLPADQVQQIERTIDQYYEAIDAVRARIEIAEADRQRFLDSWQRASIYYSGIVSRAQNNLNALIEKDTAGVDKTVDPKIERINNFYENRIARFLQKCEENQLKYDIAKQDTVLRLNLSLEYKQRLLFLASEPGLYDYEVRAYMRQVAEVDKTIAKYNKILKNGQDLVDRKNVGCAGEPENSNGPIFQRNQAIQYWEQIRAESYAAIELKWRNSGGYEYIAQHQRAVDYIQNMIGRINNAYDSWIGLAESAIAYYENQIAILQAYLQENE